MATSILDVKDVVADMIGIGHEIKPNSSMKTANDFDSAFYTVAKLYDVQSERRGPVSHMWFEINKPLYYSKSPAYFANYLIYVMLISVITRAECDINRLEKYFTDQMISFCFEKEGRHLALTEIYKYWKKANDFIFAFIQRMQKYKEIIPYYCIYLYSPHTNKPAFRQFIPAVTKVSETEVHVHLVLRYTTRTKPKWHRIPFIYKIYSHFLQMGVTPSRIYIDWLHMSGVQPDKHEVINYNSDVQELISRYKDISPYPYINPFADECLTFKLKDIIKTERVY